jgi:hypothetical protein
MHYEITNIRCMLLNMLHGFMHVINIQGKHYTKNYYFS